MVTCDLKQSFERTLTSNKDWCVFRLQIAALELPRNDRRRIK